MARPRFSYHYSGHLHTYIVAGTIHGGVGDDYYFLKLQQSIKLQCSLKNVQPNVIGSSHHTW